MVAFLLSIFTALTGFFFPHSFGGGTITLATSTIASAEDAYFQSTGKYLQILPGSKLPNYETGTLSSKLGANVPTDISIDTYEAPNGKGYQIQYTDSLGRHSIANGPEAIMRTYDVLFEVGTTTPL